MQKEKKRAERFRDRLEELGLRVVNVRERVWGKRRHRDGALTVFVFTRCWMQFNKGCCKEKAVA